MSIVVDDVELNQAPEPDKPTEGAATPTSDFEMPEKFAGKSTEDVIKSYLEVEKELGRKNNEVGELRKLTDQYLMQELDRSTTTKTDPQSEKAPIEFDDLMERPDEVISKAVDEKLASVNQRFEQMAVAQRAEKFHKENPDYAEISNDQSFYDWANASPYRARTLMAAQNGDFDAADEILQGYRGDVLEKAEAAKAAEESKREEQLNQASVESAGTGLSPEQTFSRAALMKLYINDPDQYKAMLPDIERAYAEGRVTN